MTVGVDARPGDQSGGQCAPAGDQYSAGLELGAVATAQRAHPVVSAHFGKGKRARRIGIVAVARKLLIALWRYVTTRRRPGGGDAEHRVGGPESRVSRARRVRFVTGRLATVTEKYRRSRVRIETAWSLGAARDARARIEAEGWVMDPDIAGPA